LADAGFLLDTNVLSEVGKPRPDAQTMAWLVGTGEERGRDRQSERVRGLQIDYELELGRQQHRQVGRLLPVQDAACIDTDLLISFNAAWSVAHQAARRHLLAPLIDF